MLVYLPVCGFVSGNRARTPARASASRTRASRSRDTTRNGRFARPCDRSTYTYMPSGRSPARLVSFSRVPLGVGPKQSRAWHLWSSSSREECPRLRTPLATAFGGSLRSGDTPFHTAMLPRLSLAIRVVMPRRQNTSSLPHSRLSAQSASRISACHSALRSATLPASSLHVKPLQAKPTDTN